MKLRPILSIALRTAEGVAALYVTFRGFRGAYGIDFRIDTLISAIYCALPLASFFVFLLIKPPKRRIALHSIIALGYLSVFSFLNWRTCAALGYCSTVASTVLMTLETKPVLAAFAVILFSSAAERLQASPSSNKPLN
jgi:hypothetical protein